jgi:hypothetical protein
VSVSLQSVLIRPESACLHNWSDQTIPSLGQSLDKGRITRIIFEGLPQLENGVNQNPVTDKGILPNISDDPVLGQDSPPVLYKIHKHIHHPGFQANAFVPLGDSSHQGLDKPFAYIEIRIHFGIPWLLPCPKFSMTPENLFVG